MGHVHVSLFHASFSVLFLCQSYSVLITVVSSGLLCSSISSVFFPSLNSLFHWAGDEGNWEEKNYLFLPFSCLFACLSSFSSSPSLSRMCVCVCEKIDLARSEKQYLTAPIILVLINHFPYFLHIPLLLTHPKNVLFK